IRGLFHICKSLLGLVEPAPLLPGIASARLHLVAALSEERRIAASFKWIRGLLAAACSDYRRPLRRILAISTTASIAAASLIVLFCLAAGLTPLGRRVAALAEKRLIGSRKGEFLSTVTAGELHISSH